MSKSILKITLLCFACLQSLVSFSQATWNGSVSSNWMDANNWTWTSGSGVPNSNTDVIINNLTPNIATVANSNIAKVRSITLSNYTRIEIKLNASLEVHGNITGGTQSKIECVEATNNNTLNSSIKFIGSTLQEVSKVKLATAKLFINKTDGNVVLKDSSQLYLLDTLFFNAPNANVGDEAVGNLIIDATSFLSIDGYSGHIKAVDYTDDEIPPHIIILGGNNYDIQNNVIVEKYYNLSSSSKQLFGRYDFPLGVSASQFSPLSINTGLDSLNEALRIGINPSMFAECTQGNFDITNATQFMYQIYAFDRSTNEYEDSLSIPLSVVFKYLRTTLQDSAKFGANMIAELYQKFNDTTCYNYILSTQSGFGNNYHEFSTVIYNNAGPNYTVLSTLFDVMDSVVINVLNDEEAKIQDNNGGTLQLEGKVYPLTISQDIIWSIVPETGEATIDQTGLVTASKSGTVLAIGKAGINPNFADTIQIEIGNISINKISNANFLIWPNPATDKLMIKSKNNVAIRQFVIADILGKNISNISNNNNVIDISKLAPGSYFLEIIEDNGNKSVHKFIKE